MKKWMFLIVCMLPLFGWGQELKQGKYIEMAWQKNAYKEIFTFPGEGVLIYTEVTYHKKTKETEYQLEWLDEKLVAGAKKNFRFQEKRLYPVFVKLDPRNKMERLRNFRVFQGKEAIHIFVLSDNNQDFHLITHTIESLERIETKGQLRKYEGGGFNYKGGFEDVSVFGMYAYVQASPDKGYDPLKDFPNLTCKYLYKIHIITGEVEYIAVGPEDEQNETLLGRINMGMKILDHSSNPELWIKYYEYSKIPRFKSPESIQIKILRFDESGEELPPFSLDTYEGKTFSLFWNTKLEGNDGYQLIGTYSINPKVRPNFGLFSAVVSSEGEIAQVNFYDYEKFDMVLSHYKHDKSSYSEWRDKKLNKGKVPSSSPIRLRNFSVDRVGDQYIMNGSEFTSTDNSAGAIVGTKYHYRFMTLFDDEGLLKSFNGFPLKSQEIEFGRSRSLIFDQIGDSYVGVYPSFEYNERSLVIKRNKLESSNIGVVILDDEFQQKKTETIPLKPKSGGRFSATPYVTGHLKSGGIEKWGENEFLFWDSAEIGEGKGARQILYFTLLEYAD